MVEQVTMWRSYGQVFDSKEEAEEYEKSKEIEKVVAESHRLMKSAPDRTKDQVLSEVKSVGAVTELRNKPCHSEKNE